jgi:uncharacterized protein involved in tellurium resistance
VSNQIKVSASFTSAGKYTRRVVLYTFCYGAASSVSDVQGYVIIRKLLGMYFQGKVQTDSGNFFCATAYINYGVPWFGE